MSRYEFDASTISWAERRVKELGQSRVKEITKSRPTTSASFGKPQLQTQTTIC